MTSLDRGSENMVMKPLAKMIFETSRFAVMVVLFSVPYHLCGVLAAAQAPQKSQDQPFAVEYYYKAKWGFADEFIRLFKKNHYPVLKKQVDTGRILQVTAVRQRYHSTEDGRWDYRVTIVFKNLLAAHEAGGEESIIKQLYPDQETFKREEQRRFEILLAHWDVPVVSVALDQ